MGYILKFVKLNLWDPYMGFEKKAEILKRKTEQLISRRKDIMDAVKDAELHSSKKRKAEVDNWKKDVENLENILGIYKGRMTCDSIQRITFRHCGNPKRLPFTLPLINGQPSAPPALEEIKMIRKEWESLEWDHPQFNNVLLLFVKH
ncbi:hypothetical protein A4A49_30600 [Nicotiana attenuata]|uniref:Uncharacterized protein n=1 Tax=Nicotiana attenuata TaxID=49451 RepID=A0A1J6HXP0_NICAT|nr:hypothetical protein A4A49_30600 [Nicotiana attenuata]